LILLAGANPNTRSMFQNNAPILCVTAKEGFADMAALLLEFHANVDAVSESGMSALCYAAAAGYIEIMRMLCLKNARVRSVVLNLHLNILTRDHYSVIPLFEIQQSNGTTFSTNN